MKKKNIVQLSIEYDMNIWTKKKCYNYWTKKWILQLNKEKDSTANYLPSHNRTANKNSFKLNKLKEIEWKI